MRFSTSGTRWTGFRWARGVVVFDFNNDGLQDIYVASKPSWGESPDQIDGANALYRNDGNGTFTDVAQEAGVDELDGPVQRRVRRRL